MQLYIGNKNYSSWSLRPWLLMTEAGIPFDESNLRLDLADGSAFKTTLLSIAPTGRVPLLVDDGFAVWDSLAIAEYLAEKFPDRQLWPVDARQRARARCFCAEMHAGFADMRNLFPMNVEASLVDAGRAAFAVNAAAQRDVARIDALFTDALDGSGGPFLFGATFGIVDAYFAPVCVRIRTYGLPVGSTAQAYVGRILALPSFLAWETAALAEHDFIADDEPYRTP
jgi:glutathione S-transferase